MSIRRLSDGDIVKAHGQAHILEQRPATFGRNIAVRDADHGRCIYGHGARRCKETERALMNSTPR